MLHRKQHVIFSVLAELGRAYPGQTLVLMCFDDLSKPGAWCHRTMFAEWYYEKTGVSVPELGKTSPPPAADQQVLSF